MANQSSTKVRIDWRRDGEDDFRAGPPEDANNVDREAILGINKSLGWEKYRIVDVDDVDDVPTEPDEPKEVE